MELFSNISRIIIIIVYVVMIICGLVGNSFGFYLVLRRKVGNCVMNLFMVNMVVVDLFVILFVMFYLVFFINVC